MTGSTLRFMLACGLGMAPAHLPASGWAQATTSTRPKAECQAAGRPDRLQGLTPEGDLILESGRLAKLSGIRLADRPPYRNQALTWLRARAGEPVFVQGGSARDRWDRASVRIRSQGAGSALDWAHGLI